MLTFSDNSLKVLKSRYLINNETPEELFKRVAIHIGIADILHDELIFTKIEDRTLYQLEEKFTEDINIGEYHLNQYHLEAFSQLYSELNQLGCVNISKPKLVKMINDGKFDKYAENIKIYYDLMVNQEFMPNTPTLMNAGASLGQLSACFSGEQPIMTRDGIKNIKNIQKNEYVLTDKHRYRKVIDIMNRKTDHLLTINVKKLPKNTLKVTGEHPILTLKNGKKEWVHANELKPGDYVNISYPNEVINVESINIIDYLNSDNYEVDDGLIFKINIDKKLNRTPRLSVQTKTVKNKIIIDYDFMKLLGYFASEGDAGENEVRFTFGSHEIDYHEDVVRICKDKFGVEPIVTSWGAYVTIMIHSKTFATFINGIIGSGFNTKKLPYWMELLPVEKQRGFIVGSFRGDSCLSMNGNTHAASLVMCNFNLVNSSWNMLMRMGVVSNLNKKSIPKLGTEHPYLCSINYNECSELMSEIYGFNIPNSVKNTNYVKQHYKRINNDVFFQVTEILESNESDTDVYNLEVEEDHTYVANNVSVHNCFTLSMPDDLEGIMDTCKDAAIIFKSGGGVGINYSTLREEGAKVKSTDGVASGPLSFMEIVNSITNVIKQGGKRRGANMGILDIDHPDILKFIESKKTTGVLENFNISVGMWDKPESYDKLDIIVESAHSSAEPGVLFFDNINKHNPLLEVRGKPINITNPCGEIPLYENESCNLGSINVAKMFKNDCFDWKMYEKTIRLCTRFLDNVIDVNKYPTKAINKASKETRRIGLGVMGVADLLFMMDIKYDSQRGLDIMDKLAEKLTYYSMMESIELAKERGSFDLLSKITTYEPPVRGYHENPSTQWVKLTKSIIINGIRNVLTTTVAPTGTISMIADCSNGIEPVFALDYRKSVSVGDFDYVNPLLEKRLLDEGLDITTQNIPKHIKDVFVTAMDMHWSDHVKAQAVWQKWIGNSISKTINMPEDVTIQDVKEAYKLAHKLGCKGITVYVDGSRDSQVLYTNKNKVGK